MSKLDEIGARLKAATPGPWGPSADQHGWKIKLDGVQVRAPHLCRDLALIIHAPTDLAYLLEIAWAAMELANAAEQETLEVMPCDCEEDGDERCTPCRLKAAVMWYREAMAGGAS